MDHLTPPLLIAVREVRWSLCSGFSTKHSLQTYLDRADDNLSRQLRDRWILHQQGAVATTLKGNSSPHLETFWNLIERGARGEPILEAMQALEDELESLAGQDIEDHLAGLPFKALVPLLFLHFPAFAIILLGPLLRDLQRHLLLVALILFAGPALAHSLADSAIQKIAHARSAKEIERVASMAQDLQLKRQACAVELKEKRVPYTCFAALHLESKWGLTKNSLNAQSELNQRCRAAAFQFRGTAAGDLTVLSKSCRKEVENARAVSAYKSADDWREL